MQGVAKRIETAANIGIIITALCFVTFLGWRQFRPVATRQPFQAQGLKAGDIVRFAGMDWRSHRLTCVIALQSSCKYCVRSLPELRVLTAEASRRNDIRFLAIFPKGDKDAPLHVAQIGHEVEWTARDFATDGIASTPSIYLVGENGVVRSAWHGQITAATREAILATMRN